MWWHALEKVLKQILLCILNLNGTSVLLKDHDWMICPILKYNLELFQQQLFLEEW